MAITDHNPGEVHNRFRTREELEPRLPFAETDDSATVADDSVNAHAVPVRVDEEPTVLPPGEVTPLPPAPDTAVDLAPSPEPKVTPAETKRPRRIGRIAGGFAAAAALLGLGVAIGGSGDDDSEGTPAPAVAPALEISETNSNGGELNDDEAGTAAETESESTVLQPSDLEPIYVDSTLTDEALVTATLNNMNTLRNGELPTDPAALDALLDVVYDEAALDNREFIVDSSAQAHAMRLNFPDGTWTQNLDYIVPGSGVETPRERSVRVGTTATGPTEITVRESTAVYHPVLLDGRYQWKFYTFRDSVTLSEQSI